MALACHIGLANRRTKPGYATPPRKIDSRKFIENMAERARIKRMILSNSFNYNMMRESFSTINDFLFSTVSIECDGFDGV